MTISTPLQGCGEEKDLSLFPEQTSKNGLPQKTCQECQGKTKAEWRSQIASGEREVGQGMAFHTPIVDGKKQCRQCEVWKPDDSDHFMTRAATGGLFHECKDCRRENARKYCHAIWNAAIRERRLTDEAFRLKGLHRSLVHRVAIRRQFRTWNTYIDEIGCRGLELHAWLDFQFDANMTWQNYGKSGRLDPGSCHSAG